MPRSWQHFCYGQAYLGRAYLRAQRGQAEAVRLGQADETGFRTWHDDLTRRLEPRLPGD